MKESFEPKKEDPKPLGYNKAHKLANMMQVEGRERMQTKEDYDKALVTIEVMKKMAEEEPRSLKLTVLFARLLTSEFFKAVEIGNRLRNIGKDDDGLFNWKAYKAEGLEMDKQRVLRTLEDAAVRLRNLRDDADKLGRHQNIILDQKKYWEEEQKSSEEGSAT